MSADAFRPFRERVAEDEAQVIAFQLGGELHACDIQLVEEVVTKRRIHRPPDMPPRLLGMLRLRGELVPVLEVVLWRDLVLGIGHPVVLVVGWGGLWWGVAGDAAQDVVALTPADYRPAPHTGGERDEYVVGVARVDGRLVSLIDLAEMLREVTTAAG